MSNWKVGFCALMMAGCSSLAAAAPGDAPECAVMQSGDNEQVVNVPANTEVRVRYVRPKGEGARFWICSSEEGRAFKLLTSARNAKDGQPAPVQGPPAAVLTWPKHKGATKLRFYAVQDVSASKYAYTNVQQSPQKPDYGVVVNYWTNGSWQDPNLLFELCFQPNDKKAACPK